MRHAFGLRSAAVSRKTGGSDSGRITGACIHDKSTGLCVSRPLNSAQAQQGNAWNSWLGYFLGSPFRDYVEYQTP